jgi:hypothetical protein
MTDNSAELFRSHEEPRRFIKNGGGYMKRFLLISALIALTSPALLAQDKSAFLSPLHNAQFVYVTSYSGSQFSPNPLPEDRQAINAVQDALQNWGHYTIVYRPEDADMIIAVERRHTEDVLAAYDRQSWQQGTFLWRAMAKNGLRSPKMPLMHKLELALAKVNGKTPA